jgi:hypothetical protein
MRQVVLAVVTIISVASFAGCATPCFYQAGKSVEQCERDLVQCIDQARGQQKSQSGERIRSCMQAKGYKCLDASKVSRGAKQIVVIAPFETYRVLDGHSTAPASDTAVAGQQLQQSSPDTPTPQPIGYRARQDATGKYVITPVYRQRQTEKTDSAKLADGGK